MVRSVLCGYYVYGKRTLSARSELCWYPIHGKRTVLARAALCGFPGYIWKLGHTLVFTIETKTNFNGFILHRGFRRFNVTQGANREWTKISKLSRFKLKKPINVFSEYPKDELNWNTCIRQTNIKPYYKSMSMETWVCLLIPWDSLYHLYLIKYHLLDFKTWMWVNNY